MSPPSESVHLWRAARASLYAESLARYWDRGIPSGKPPHVSRTPTGSCRTDFFGCFVLARSRIVPRARIAVPHIHPIHPGNGPQKKEPLSTIGLARLAPSVRSAPLPPRLAAAGFWPHQRKGAGKGVYAAAAHGCDRAHEFASRRALS